MLKNHKEKVMCGNQKDGSQIDVKYIFAMIADTISEHNKKHPIGCFLFFLQIVSINVIIRTYTKFSKRYML